MAKTKISEFSATPGNNTDIDGINIAEGCAPSGINDAIRELMSQLKDFQAGTAGDSFNGPVGTTTAAAGAFTTLSASSTVSGTGFSNYLASPPAIGGTTAAAGSFTTLTTSSTVTHNGGTANGVAYLNGSKVLTTGSALTFDGTNFGVANTSGSDVTLLTLTSNSGLRQQFNPTNSTGTKYNWRIDVNGLVDQTWSLIPSTAVGGSIFSTPVYQAHGNGTQIWSVGSSEQMRLTTTGLGIGTSSPTQPLTVGGSGNILVSSGATFFSSGRLYIRAGSGQSLDFGANDANSLMQLSSSGNLGLGVTPSAQLDVLSANNIVGQFKRSSGEGGIRVGNTTGTFYIGCSGTYVYMDSGTSNPYYFYQGATRSMTLDASGNLVVGTTSANGRLTIDSGSAALMGSFNSTNANGGYIILSTSGTVYGDIGTAFQAVGGSASDFAINARGARNLVFGANNTERARIDSSGNLLIAKTSLSGTTVGFQLKATGEMNSGMAASTNSDSTLSVYSTGASAYRFYVGLGGTIYATSTTISAISDIRFKENVRDLDAGLEKIMALKPRLYDWKENKGANIKNARGFIAQEFEQVFPDLIDEWKDPAPEGEEPYKSVRQDLIPVLVKALQEMKQIVDAQAARIAALEAK